MTEPQPSVVTDATDTTSADPTAPPARGWGEWAVAAGVAGLGVVVLVDGLGQKASTSASGIGAGFLPTIVGSLLLILAITLGVQLARGKRGEAEQAEGDVDLSRTRWIPLLVTVLSIVFFIVAVEPLGYLLTAPITMFAIAWAMGARKWWSSAIIAIVVCAVIYFSFTRLLTIDLPAGVLEGIL